MVPWKKNITIPSLQKMSIIMKSYLVDDISLVAVFRSHTGAIGKRRWSNDHPDGSYDELIITIMLTIINLIYKFRKPIFCRTLGLSPPQASRASLRLAAAALAVGTRQQEAIRRSRMVKVEMEEERSTMVVPSLDYF